MKIETKQENKMTHVGKKHFLTYKYGLIYEGKKYIFKHYKAASNFHNKIKQPK